MEEAGAGRQAIHDRYRSRGNGDPLDSVERISQACDCLKFRTALDP